MKNSTNLLDKQKSKLNAIIKRPITFISVAAILCLVIVYAIDFSKIKSKTKEDHCLRINHSVYEMGKTSKTYSVDAERGDTITYESGSQIIIPANCFVDENGHQMTGKVEIQYREFCNTADILLSGIPMAYDSGGVRHNFESAGMMEIKGYQNNKPVFINANKAISVNMASTLEKPGINLYRFDTIKNNWVMLGKDSVNNTLAIEAEKSLLKEKLNPTIDPLCVTALQLIDKKQESKKLLQLKPVLPVLANANKSSFTIDFDKEEFSELSEFENVKFEINDNKTKINLEDTALIWENVSIKKASDNNYAITFSTSEKKLHYNVIPVFDQVNMEKAKVIFEEKYKAYNKKLEENKLAIALAQKKLQDDLVKAQKEVAIAREKAQKDEQQIRKIAEERAIQMAKEQAELNKKTEQEFAAQQAEIMNQIEIQRQANLKAREKILAVSAALNAVTRSFEVNQFGIYNCDRLYANNFKDYFLKVNLNNKEESKIVVLYIIYKNIRGAITCYPEGENNNYRLRLNKKEDCKLVAIIDTKEIGICSSQELLQAIKTEENTINMDVSKVNFSNESELSDLINF